MSDYWGLRYVRTSGWHARGLTQKQALDLAARWEFHASVPILAVRDPDYEQDRHDEEVRFAHAEAAARVRR